MAKVRCRGARLPILAPICSALDAIKQGAARYGSQVTIQFGHAEFVGDTEGSGTDREQRNRARQVYERVSNESPVSRSEEIWSGVRDRWSAAAGEVALHRIGREIDKVDKAPGGGQLGKNGNRKHAKSIPGRRAGYMPVAGRAGRLCRAPLDICVYLLSAARRSGRQRKSPARGRASGKTSH
jgi:hypothetical protein